MKTVMVAGFLGVSQTSLRKYAAAGKIPVRINPANGYRLFKRSDLEKFLKAAAEPVKSNKPKKK